MRVALTWLVVVGAISAIEGPAWLLADPPMRTFLGVPIVIAGRAFGNLYLTEKAGGERFTAEDEQAAVVLAEFAAVAVENAQLYGGAKRQRDELARTVATLEATSHVTRAVGGETDLAVVLEMVAKRGRALVPAAGAACQCFADVKMRACHVGRRVPGT